MLFPENTRVCLRSVNVAEENYRVIYEISKLSLDFCVTQRQNKLLEYLFPKNDTKKERLLPVENYSDAVTVDFRITLIKIKDVVSQEIFCMTI